MVYFQRPVVLTMIIGFDEKWYTLTTGRLGDLTDKEEIARSTMNDDSKRN